MRIFFRAIIVQLLLNLYVYWRGRQALPSNKAVQIIYASVFGFELAAYLFAFIGRHHLPLDTLHNLTWIGTSWMLFIIYFTVFLLLYDVVRFIDKKKKILPKSLDLKDKKPRLIYYCCALLCVLGIMSYGSYRFHNPVVTEITLNIDKKSPNVDNLKIVAVADLHIGVIINKDILKMYVNKIMEQKPDMILLAGDIIDYDLQSVVEQRMEEELKQLKAPYGVYASTGNHEYIHLEREGENAKINWLRDKSGLTLLQDTTIMVADSFYVVGREDDKCKTRKPLSQLVEGINKELPLIVINHEPHHLQEEVDAGADIAFYGHTHNGQTFPNNLILKLLYEKSYGYEKKEDTNIYVTSGLGLAGPQFRIATISEIVVFNVNFKK